MKDYVYLLRKYRKESKKSWRQISKEIGHYSPATLEFLSPSMYARLNVKNRKKIDQYVDSVTGRNIRIEKKHYRLTNASSIGNNVFIQMNDNVVVRLRKRTAALLGIHLLLGSILGLFKKIQVNLKLPKLARSELFESSTSQDFTGLTFLRNALFIVILVLLLSFAIQLALLIR